MKRAVLCVPNPHDYLDKLDDYSIMIINPDSTKVRKKYLLDNADWSLLITPQGQHHQSGGIHPDERLFWYTSGTVGDSKFYSFTVQQLERLCDSIIHDLNITANDRYVGLMGLWHAHGQSLYWATRRAGCERHFLTVKELRQVSKYQPTFLSAIPDILKNTLTMDLKHLRFLRSGSAPLSQDLYQALKDKFHIPIIEYFGMTEAMSHVLSNPLDGPQRAGTVGVPTRGVEAKLIQDHLWIRSQQAYTQEWFDTGDLAQQDSHGYYRIIGRSIDQINIRGLKFNPGSLESHLKTTLPDLGSVVLFGNQSLNCIYTGHVDPSQIISTLQSINSVCYPDMIQRMDSIPMPDTGKISRKWLRDFFNCK